MKAVKDLVTSQLPVLLPGGLVTRDGGIVPEGSVGILVTGQVARKLSLPKSYRPEPESYRPKYIVMSPEILSHVARNFIECINLKKSNILSKSQGINL